MKRHSLLAAISAIVLVPILLWAESGTIITPSRSVLPFTLNANSLCLDATNQDTCLTRASAGHVGLTNPLDTTYGGLGANNSAATGLLSFSNGTQVVSDALRAGQVLYGAAGNAVGSSASFTWSSNALTVSGSNLSPIFAVNATSGYGSLALQAGGVSKFLIGYAASNGNFGADTVAGDVSLKSEGVNYHFVPGAGNAHTLLYLSSAGAVVFGGTAVGSGTLGYTAGGGLQVGQPTGGDKGAGTISVATGYFGPFIRGGSAGVLDLGIASEGVKRVYVDYTNTATVGPVTINKASGRVNIGSGGTSVIATNSLVTAASHCFAIMSTADATGRVTSCVPAAGTLTINTVAVTATASFDFFIVNAD